MVAGSDKSGCVLYADAIMTLLLFLFDLAGVLGCLGVLLIAGNHWRLVYRHGRLARALLAHPPQPVDISREAPRLAVQIPIYNEPENAVEALRSAAQLDWPKDRLVLQILDDSTDRTSELIKPLIDELGAAGFEVQHLRRLDRTGFKAGALAAGMKATDADFFAILDVDHRVRPDWLKSAYGLMRSDPGIAFAQFRFEFRNRDANLLTRFQQLLVDSHFVIEQTGRLDAGEPFQFNGTAALWRRSAIEAAGGWSSDTLAEDLDMVVRVYQAGGRGTLALHPPALCEAPESLKAWRVQQARWSQGFSQAAVKLIPALWKTSWPLARKAGASLLLGLQLAMPATLLALVGFVGDVLLRGFSAWHGAFLGAAVLFALATLFAITWPAYRALRRGSFLDYLKIFLAVPWLFGLLALSSSPAVFGGLLGREKAFVRTPKQGLAHDGK
jgi:cellulose synthase/poly-beta-1,6-N-acetylglucosamine synthase-like glycosyltransferase